MGKLAEKLASGAQVFTAEITPPKGPGIKKLLRHADLLAPHIDAVNITDCQRALVRMSSLAASKVLLDHGLEPVFQLTCRDRNLIALQADLMGAGALGIPNVLCLTGDPVKAGDHPEAKSVFEFESVGLLNVVEKLQNGRDFKALKMNRRTRFFVGAVVNPVMKSASNQLTRMEKKIQAGARFFQTQANYDANDMNQFFQQANKFGAPILAGVLILNSYEMANYINKEIPGIHIPAPVIERFKNAKDPEQTGIDFAVDLMLTVQDSCAGFHLMTIRAEELIPKVMKRYAERRYSQENPSAQMSSGTRG